MVTAYMYTKLFCGILTVILFHKSHHKCFVRSVPLLQMRSQLFNASKVSTLLMLHISYIVKCITIGLTIVFHYFSFFC